MRPLVLTLSACLATSFASSAPEKGEKGGWHFPAKVPATFVGSPVAVVPLPAGGIQPQAAVDAAGVIHVVYFTGKPAGGDLYYVRLNADGGRTSKPVRVNSTPGSALATGSVRGAQLSLGRNGRIHVAWHGSQPTSGTNQSTTPVWYTRSADGVTFDLQRAVSGTSEGIDGGTVAAAHGLSDPVRGRWRDVHGSSASDVGPGGRVRLLRPARDVRSLRHSSRLVSCGYRRQPSRHDLVDGSGHNVT
jgi:hypothetical protein